MSKAWHNPLPTWITDDPAFVDLRQGPRHTLQVIANRCDKPDKKATAAPLLACFGGVKLIDTCGCDRATVKRHLAQLTQCGFIVPLTSGGGRLATIYGIPGERGQLDPFKADPDDKARLWTAADSSRIMHLVAQNAPLATPAKTAEKNAPAADAKRDGRGCKTHPHPSQNAPLPSPIPSSSTIPINHSPLPESDAQGDSEGGGSRDPSGGVDDEGTEPTAAEAEAMLLAVKGKGGKMMAPSVAQAIAADETARPHLRHWIATACGKRNPAGHIATCHKNHTAALQQQERARREEQAAIENAAIEIEAAEAHAAVALWSDAKIAEALQAAKAAGGRDAVLIVGNESPEWIRTNQRGPASKLRILIYRAARNTAEVAA